MATSREGDREDEDALRAAAPSDSPRAIEPAIEAEDEDAEPSFFDDPRRLALTGIFVLLAFAAIYFLLPKVIGLEGAIEKLENGSWPWFIVAVLFNVAAFGAY